MKKRIAFIMAMVLLLAACGTGSAVQPQPSARGFYYQDTTWGMTPDEVIKIKGKPDLRSDEMEKPEYENGGYAFEFEREGDDAAPEGYWDDTENTDTSADIEYLDFYYNDKTVFDKYTAREQFLFDAEQKLWGVINLVDVGEVSKDLMNRNEIVARCEETYMDIREKLTEQYGPPAAEYTAYQEEGSYKTDEMLDLKKENAMICASRWDGDDYRFIYIMYFVNGLELDVRYIPHDKEEVDAANAEKAN